MSTRPILRLFWPVVLLARIVVQFIIAGYPHYTAPWGEPYWGRVLDGYMRPLSEWPMPRYYIVQAAIIYVPFLLSLIFWFLRPGKLSLVCSMVAAWIFSGIPGLMLAAGLMFRMHA